MADEDDDICGLCQERGADKFAHPCHWPGERVPDGPFVHTECEQEECARALRRPAPESDEVDSASLRLALLVENLGAAEAARLLRSALARSPSE